VRHRLGRSAFNRPTLSVARELLGKVIVRSYRGRRIAAIIAEVEAYKGPADKASHAASGRRTARVEPLYGDGGTVYVYLVYGLHWLLNFSTAGRGRPEGVLVRGILVDTASGRQLVAGPGNVTRHLKIGKKLDGADATVSTEIWVEDRGERIAARNLTRGPRIGVGYAGRYWAAKPWRFRIAAAPANEKDKRKKRNRARGRE